MMYEGWSGIHNLCGTYDCHESQGCYKYYGRCINGPSAEWEIFLFAVDKVFKYDSIFHNPDLLVRLRGPSVCLPLSRDTCIALAKDAAEGAIEKWAAGAPEAQQYEVGG